MIKTAIFSAIAYVPLSLFRIPLPRARKCASSLRPLHTPRRTRQPPNRSRTVTLCLSARRRLKRRKLLFPHPLPHPGSFTPPSAPSRRDAWGWGRIRCAKEQPTLSLPSRPVRPLPLLSFIVGSRSCFLFPPRPNALPPLRPLDLPTAPAHAEKAACLCEPPASSPPPSPPVPRTPNPTQPPFPDSICDGR